MSDFDFLSLIKQQAKLLAKTQSIKLNAAQAAIASMGGFKHYHELQKVAVRNPTDVRLMQLALQTNDLTEVVFEENIYEQIDYMLESELSSHIAETNAEGFCIDEFIVEKANYDQSTGVLSIYAEIGYAGDQKPGRPYSGTKFNLSALICLFRRISHWEFLETDGLQITEITNDQDLDWQQQRLETSVFKDGSAFISVAETIKSTAAVDAALAGVSKSNAAMDALAGISKSTAAVDAALAGVSKSNAAMDALAGISKSTAAVDAALAGVSKSNAAMDALAGISKSTAAVDAALAGVSKSNAAMDALAGISKSTAAVDAALAGVSKSNAAMDALAGISKSTAAVDAALADAFKNILH